MNTLPRHAGNATMPPADALTPRLLHIFETDFNANRKQAVYLLSLYGDQRSVRAFVTSHHGDTEEYGYSTQDGVAAAQEEVRPVFRKRFPDLPEEVS